MSTINTDEVPTGQIVQMARRLQTSILDRIDALLVRRQELHNQIQQLKAKLAKFEGGAI